MIFRGEENEKILKEEMTAVQDSEEWTRTEDVSYRRKPGHRQEAQKGLVQVGIPEKTHDNGRCDQRDQMAKDIYYGGYGNPLKVLFQGQ